MSFELEPTRNFGSGMAALRATFSSVRDRVEAVGASKRSERAKKIHMTPGKFKSLQQFFYFQLFQTLFDHKPVAIVIWGHCTSSVHFCKGFGQERVTLIDYKVAAATM